MFQSTPRNHEQTMSAVAKYDLFALKAYVDELDATLQAAVDDGTIIAVTWEKKDAIVSKFVAGN